MKPIIDLSVRDLVEFCLRSGNLDMTTFGVISTTDGIRAHQQIQSQRSDAYQNEIFIDHEIERENYVLQINGRMDGLLVADQGVTIDEIKTTRQDLTQVELSEDPIHWGQAQCYAFMYAHKNSLQMINVQLTYCNVDDASTNPGLGSNLDI